MRKILLVFLVITSFLLIFVSCDKSKKVKFITRGEVSYLYTDTALFDGKGKSGILVDRETGETFDFSYSETEIVPECSCKNCRDNTEIEYSISMRFEYSLDGWHKISYPARYIYSEEEKAFLSWYDQ